MLGLGFIGYYLSSMLDFAGLQYITASLERLILYLGPTLVLLLGWRCAGGASRWGTGGHRRQLLRRAAGLRHRAARGAHRATAWGALLVFISTFTYALYLFYSGEFVQRLGSLRLVGLATAFACVCCIAQFLLVKPLVAAQVAPEVIWLSVLNATLCTAVPVLLVAMCVERSPAGLTGRHDRPAVDHCHGHRDPGRALHAVAGGGHGAGGGGHLHVQPGRAPGVLLFNKQGAIRWILVSRANGRWWVAPAKGWGGGRAEALAGEGVNVLMVARGAEALAAAAAEIRAACAGGNSGR